MAMEILNFYLEQVAQNFGIKFENGGLICDAGPKVEEYCFAQSASVLRV